MSTDHQRHAAMDRASAAVYRKDAAAASDAAERERLAGIAGRLEERAVELAREAQLPFDGDAAPGAKAIARVRAKESAGPKRPVGAGKSVQLGMRVRSAAWKKGDVRVVCAVTGNWAWVARVLADGEIGPMAPEPVHLLLPVGSR